MEYFILGEHLPHTHSPTIHKLLGNPDYSIRELPKDALAALFSERRFAGMNVTIPYKKAAMELCDVLDGAAIEIGAVNTVVNCDGTLYGCNTDLDGFIFLCNRAAIDLAGKKVLILGSGGTACTVYAAAKKLGAKEIHVVSRDGALNYTNVYTLHADADILVNTTPVGMFPHIDASPIELARFSSLSGVIDVIYNPLKTRLICKAEALGIPAAGGLAMLVAQAAFADRYFRGVRHSGSEIVAITEKMQRRLSNILLIGMPGCGKSAAGRRLAKRLRRKLYDVDRIIVEREGKTIPEIFAERGEPYFRDLESAIVRELSAKKGVIISTGGGTLLREENRTALRQNGRAVYIRRPLEQLARGGRPLSADADALARLYAERAPLYESFADITVSDSESIDACVEKIIRALNGGRP